MDKQGQLRDSSKRVIQEISMPSRKLDKFAIEQHQEEIKSAREFLRFISELPKSDHKFLCRGLPNCEFELLPSIGRKHCYAGRHKTFSLEDEKSLLHRFRRRAYPLVDRVVTAGEAIFVAQHHGLPTRLLDWTANPLFALYFAGVSDREKEQKAAGRVWLMHRRGPADQDLDAFRLAECKDEEALFGYITQRDAIKIVYPFYNSPRLLAQDGAFTIHRNPSEALEDLAGVSFEPENLDIEKLYCWRVPAESKVHILKELSNLGITERSVFPDLVGVAKSLWQTEVLWNGKSRAISSR